MLYFIIPTFIFAVILELIGMDEDKRKRGGGGSSE